MDYLLLSWLVAEHGVAQYLPDASADPRCEHVPGTEDELAELVGEPWIDGEPYDVVEASTPAVVSVLEKINEHFTPFRERRKELEQDPGYVDEVLRAGAAKARDAAGNGFQRFIWRVQDSLPHRSPPSRKVTAATTRMQTQRRAAVALLAITLLAGGLPLLNAIEVAANALDASTYWGSFNSTNACNGVFVRRTRVSHTSRCELSNRNAGALARRQNV